MKKLVVFFITLLCSVSSLFASVESDVLDLISKTLGTESSIKRTASFISDLGADSLATVELVAAAESRFGISITDAEMSSVETVDDFIKLIESK
jgi:acyl carrier protein